MRVAKGGKPSSILQVWQFEIVNLQTFETVATPALIYPFSLRREPKWLCGSTNQ